MQIKITRSTETDLLEGFAFYELQQSGIGDYFLDSLFADIDASTVYAGIHAKADGKLHRTLAKRFPFAIYYQVADDSSDCRCRPGLPPNPCVHYRTP